MRMATAQSLPQKGTEGTKEFSTGLLDGALLFCVFLWREPEGCEGWEVEFGAVNGDLAGTAVDFRVSVDDEFVLAVAEMRNAITFLAYGG